MNRQNENQDAIVKNAAGETILPEKYKLLRNEAIENSSKNNRQAAYIQIYGIFLFTLIGVFEGAIEDVDPNNIPKEFQIFILIVSASLLFYYYSQIYLSSFTFQVLRMRMAEIEYALNKSLPEEKHLRYEMEIAPRLFGKFSLQNKYISPNAWLQWFTLILFSVAICALIALSLELLQERPGWLIFYISSLIFFGFTLAWENFQLSILRLTSIKTTDKSDVGILTTVFVLSRYVLNYLVILLITSYIAFFSQLDDPFSAYATKIIGGFINSDGPLDDKVTLLFTTLYTMLCGLFLPTPSELPLVLSTKIGVSYIILFSAFGKAIGAMFLYLLSTLFFNWNIDNKENWQSYLENCLFGRIIENHGINILYFLSQSVPFAPMRSATIAYAAVKNCSLRSILVIIAGSFFGTISRMGIIGVLVSAGMWIIPIVGGAS